MKKNRGLRLPKVRTSVVPKRYIQKSNAKFMKQIGMAQANKKRRG